MAYRTPEQLEAIALLHFATAYCPGLRSAEVVWAECNEEFRAAIRRQVQSVLDSASSLEGSRHAAERQRLQLSAAPDELQW
jgi:hypothetical protein